MSNKAIRAKGGNKPRKTMLYFRPNQWNALIALSEDTGAPISELVRRAVDSYLRAVDSYLKERKKAKK